MSGFLFKIFLSFLNVIILTLYWGRKYPFCYFLQLIGMRDSYFTQFLQKYYQWIFTEILPVNFDRNTTSINKRDWFSSCTIAIQAGLIHNCPIIGYKQKTVVWTKPWNKVKPISLTWVNRNNGCSQFITCPGFHEENIYHDPFFKSFTLILYFELYELKPMDIIQFQWNNTLNTATLLFARQQKAA